MEEGYFKATAKPVDENNVGETADVDSPPEGIDPDELPIRNIHMNDGRMEDECEEISAGVKEPELDSEGE